MFTQWILSLLINSIALLVVEMIFDGIQIGGVGSVLLASLILSILNTLIKPILIILTLPITILTLGLFLIVINAITLMVTQAIMSSFAIDGFGLAIIASIIISIINLLLNNVIRRIVK